MIANNVCKKMITDGLKLKWLTSSRSIKEGDGDTGPRLILFCPLELNIRLDLNIEHSLRIEPSRRIEHSPRFEHSESLEETNV